MPKETITGSHGSPYDVKVGWSPNGSMQVAVEVRDEKSLFWQLLENYTTELGEAMFELCHETVGANPAKDMGKSVLNILDTVSHGGYAGLWCDLDREGCNRLIKLIRKARDTAYGRDE